MGYDLNILLLYSAILFELYSACFCRAYYVIVLRLNVHIYFTEFYIIMFCTYENVNVIVSCGLWLFIGERWTLAPALDDAPLRGAFCVPREYPERLKHHKSSIYAAFNLHLPYLELLEV